jgi:2-methylcitrate dehydratase PrpD
MVNNRDDKMGTFTIKLAHWAANVKTSDLPENALNRASELLLDWVGAALAGSVQPLAAMADSVLEENIAGLGATVLKGPLKKATPLWAAFLNGFNSHILEIDDTHQGSLFHPGAVVMSSALALGEKYKVSGLELLAAIVVGYEVAIRIAEVAGGKHYQYWHTTGTCGTFGAAATAVRILRLNQEQMVSAIGMAGTQAAGLWQFLPDQATCKPLHPAKAAFNGILAAMLAERGLTGPHHILEGEKGFFKATADCSRLDLLLQGLGERYTILEVSIKPYASCRHSHALIDAALDIAGRPGFQYQNIKKVKIRTYQTAIDIAGGNGVYPSTPIEAKFNSIYCISLALSRKQVVAKDFEPGVIQEDRFIKELYPKITLEKGEEFERQFPEKWAARMEVEMEDGEFLTSEVNFPKGDPHNPLDNQELRSKFGTFAGFVLEDSKVSILADRLLAVKNEKDISRIFEI